MAREQILIVDDEEDIQELVRYNLERDGYRVRCVGSGEEALNQAFSKPPDMVILDLMLPNLDGLETCRTLRAHRKTATIPIIMLTAKGEETDIVAGLELGADDYIVKPFSPRVLTARVRSLFRKRQRAMNDETKSVAVGDIVIDVYRHEVMVNTQPVELTATEFAILLFLAKQPGRVFSREQIIDGVKGKDYPVTDRAVDVQMVNLRKKLGDSGDRLETVRGVGYRLGDNGHDETC